MPAFKDDLSDLELASVLTYVRTSWGNKGKPVSASDVAAARAKLKTIKKPREPAGPLDPSGRARSPSRNFATISRRRP